MVIAWHGRSMASVNQTRPHCVNQMGKTHSKTLSGTAWARQAMCESAFTGFGGGNPKDRNRLENLDVDARIILKWILKK